MGYFKRAEFWHRTGSDDAALDWSEAYAGVFASFGRTDNRIVPDPISWMV